jgi:hypothetical protein
MSEKRAKMERKIKPGEYQSVRAMEEVTRRNVESGIQFANDTRKMVLELKGMFDALQSNVMNMKTQQDQIREQLTNLQQQFYLKGTTSYADGDKG